MPDRTASSGTRRPIKVLFVCTGNICRSPTAEAIFRKMLDESGLSEVVVVESAGTHDYHAGEPPDRRMQVAARKRGYDLTTLRARRVAPGSLQSFDYVLAMDRSHLRYLRSLWGGNPAPTVHLFLEFSAEDVDEVPDPYYGGPDGFEQVLDLIEAASAGLLRDVRERLARN